MAAYPRILAGAAAACGLVEALVIRVTDPGAGWALPGILAALGLLFGLVLWPTPPARLIRSLAALLAVAVGLTFVFLGLEGAWPLRIAAAALYGTVGYLLILVPAAIVASFVTMLSTRRKDAPR